MTHRALEEAELRGVLGGTLGPSAGSVRPSASPAPALAGLPVLPGLPPWIERAIGSWAGSLARHYAQAFLTDAWEHRVESTAQALPPMALRPLAERTHRWLN